MLKEFFSSARTYFNFHRNERNGILAILVIIVSLLIFNAFLPDIIPSRKIDYKPYQEKIAAWKKEREIQPVTQREIQYFLFDPNTLDSTGFITLGLNPAQAKTILHYRSKGGKFRSPEDFKKIYGIQDSLYVRLKPYIRIRSGEISGKRSGTKSPLPYAVFDFDPNTISADSLKLLGFSAKTASQIINYRKKGGRFYQKEQLLKIYNMDTLLYTKLKEHIIIKAKKLPHFPKDSLFHKSQTIHIELNTADTLDLQQLYGIGSGFARRIVKYRKLLGGYRDKRQLLEVWGMDPKRYEGISEQIYVDTTQIRKINVNTATIKQLIKHPYIDFVLAKRIVLLRKQKGGKFQRIDELREIDLFYDDLYRKVSPYLKAE